MKIRDTYIEKLLFAFLGLLLMIYMVARAIYVPFTFDEAATFFHFVHKADFWYFYSLPDANNHLINTILTYLSYILFGSSKLALRLPNLLALPLYLYFVFKISTLFKQQIIKWIWLIIFVSLHFFIEFFALSRGYGLSMAFLMGAIYQLIRYNDEGKSSHIVYTSLWLFLTQFSNLSTLVLIIAVIAYEMTVVYLRKEPDIKKTKQYVLIILLQILPLIFSSAYMFFLSNKGSLYYGNDSGFWNLTVQSLILLITGHKLHMYSALTGMYILLILLGVANVVRSKGARTLLLPKLVIPILLITTVIGVVLLSEFFDINHPEDRVAMYFVPLFFGSILMLLDYFYYKTHFLIFIFLTIPLLMFPIHFMRNMNYSYVNGYKTEVLPERFFSVIDEDELSEREFPPTIGGYRMRMFCWQYLNFTNGGYHNMIDYQSYPETQSDFQIVDTDEYPEWFDYYDVIHSEDVLGRKILKRKTPLGKSFTDSEIITSEIQTAEEFVNLASWDINELNGDSYYLTVDMNILSESTPLNAWVVIHIFKGKETATYKYIPLGWLKTKWTRSAGSFKHSFLTGKIEPGSSQIKVYIWNIDEVSLKVERSKVNLYTITD